LAAAPAMAAAAVDFADRKTWLMQKQYGLQRQAYWRQSTEARG